MKRTLEWGVFFVMIILTSAAQSQTTYDSKTLVDTNNTSNSTSTVTSNNTNTSTSTVNSVTTNNNINTSTNVNTNHNINSGTQTINNNNHNTGEVTYKNINTGDMTNRNISTSTSTSNNTNNNISDNTNRNINTGDMTNRNINVSTSENKNTSVSTSDNVNRNVQTGDMTNRNINDSTITQKVIQPPPTAIAPAMMSGGNNDLCTTGTSGSVQTQILGVSSGGTVRDLNCERLKLSKTLFDMGMKVAAVATMCQDRRVFDAMMSAGTPCPYEGKIGDTARELWLSNPDKIPPLQIVKTDDTFKKVGIGSLLGVIVYTIFGK